MATKVLPVLGGEGWVSDPNTIMNKLFMSVFLTDYSQSNIYHGNVSSLQYLISEYPDNLNTFKYEIENMFKTLYERYFENVTVTFNNIEDPDEGLEKAAVDYTVSIDAMRNGIVYELNKTMRINFSSGVSRFLDAFDSSVK